MYLYLILLYKICTQLTEDYIYLQYTGTGRRYIRILCVGITQYYKFEGGP